MRKVIEGGIILGVVLTTLGFFVGLANPFSAPSAILWFGGQFFAIVMLYILESLDNSLIK